MPAYEFAVELTVPDNTAFTVLKALRDLGYADLERVERGDLLRLSFKDGSMSREACAAALTRAEVVFNPNKHRLGMQADGDLDVREAVVSDIDDDTAALAETLGDHFAIGGIDRIERAVAWRLFDRDGAASSERLDWACRELLANRFSQRYEVRTRPAYVYL